MKLKMLVICPDTSPRGLNLPGEKDHWDFGLAASFYVMQLPTLTAITTECYSYIKDELYDLVNDIFL